MCIRLQMIEDLNQKNASLTKTNATEQNNVATLCKEEGKLKEEIGRSTVLFSNLEAEQQSLQNSIAEKRATRLENETAYQDKQIEHGNKLKDIAKQMQLLEEKNLKKCDDINEVLEKFKTETDEMLASAMNDRNHKAKELKEEQDKVTANIRDLEAQISTIIEQQEDLSQKHMN